ncbi:heavy metal-associated isoprenylated plant protein 6-like [Nymphaea colorata]|nr:heavy metal-associated isoprenylated plant protein 6-like [Nymphaea colorata]
MKWVIEANIDCCDGCRERVEKYLKRVQGVESVDLYPEESKVVVTGDVDPTIVLAAVKKVKKEARMLTKDASAKNLSALVDAYDNRKKKIIPVDAVIPMKEAASKKAIVIYKPPKPSDGKDKVASETKTYGLNLYAYGFGAGVYYKCNKTYKK